MKKKKRKKRKCPGVISVHLLCFPSNQASPLLQTSLFIFFFKAGHYPLLFSDPSVRAQIR